MIQVGRNMQPSIHGDGELTPSPSGVRLIALDLVGVPILHPRMGSRVGIVLVG